MKLCASVLVTVLLAQQFGSAQGSTESMIGRAAFDAARTTALDTPASHLERIRTALADAARPSSRLATLDYRTVEALAAQNSQGTQQQSSGRTRKIVIIVVVSLVALVVIGSTLVPSSSNNPGPPR